MRGRAIFMLLLATAAWGFSFPGGKALMSAMEQALPGRSTWFYSSLTMSARFALAALLLWAVNPRAWVQLKTNEWRQGIGLGIFGGFGMLAQADGLMHTEASTSAFLTQFAAVLVPLYVMLRDKRFPSIATVVCVVMVMAGCAILGRFDFAQLRLGRGEAETLLGAVFFTGQILWLERPGWAGNDTGRVSMVMFATVALAAAPIFLLTMQSPTDASVLIASAPMFGLFVVTTLVCSIFAFVMMNRWQPHVDATTAGIVYCAEPLFATALALFLPAVLASLVGIAYANESFTTHLVIGGALITAANVLISLTPPRARAEADSP
ncbi:MAG: DMT family transporter [Chthoniobacteraceae bacterium]